MAIQWSANSDTGPRFAPVMATVTMPPARAASIAFTTFLERPEVEIPHQHVTASPQRLDLAGENMLIAEVVADGGQGRGIHRQGQSRHARSVEHEFTDQLRSQMLAVAGTAAIAAKHHLAAAGDRFRACRTDAFHRIDQRLVGADQLHDLGGLGNLTQYIAAQTILRFVRQWYPTSATGTRRRRYRSCRRPADPDG